MSFVQWNEKYVTQIQLLDEHHQTLFSLVNQLYNDVFECQDISEEQNLTQTILAELENYVDYHFSAEEQLLSRYQYPDYMKHVEAHNLFRHEIARLSEQLKSGQASLSFTVFDFLRNWLTTHILITDKKYSSWLVERGVK